MYEAQLQDLQKRAFDTEGIADPETLKLQQQGLQTRLEQKKGELEDKEKIKNELATANELALEKQVAADNMENIKTLIKLLGPTGIQGDMVKDITAPLAKVMQSLVKGINPDYDFIFDLGTEEKPKFDLVCQIKGSWVLFDSLSGGESVVFSAALATALMIHKNPACKILCLEAGECDDETAALLLQGLDELSGNLDNIIICSHNEDLFGHLRSSGVSKGWKLCVL
jgi:DNA repair exonuclease SbcCD ATPase subunit